MSRVQKAKNLAYAMEALFVNKITFPRLTKKLENTTFVLALVTFNYLQVLNMRMNGQDEDVYVLDQSFKTSLNRQTSNSTNHV